MDITVETLQSFLDDAWDAAPSEANTLRDQLRTYEKAATALFRGGSLASVAKNSVSQAYRGPGLGSLTPVQIANAWRQLINLFDTIKAGIDTEAAEDGAAPVDDDPTIYGNMQTVLRTVTDYTMDFTLLRLPATASGPFSC